MVCVHGEFAIASQGRWHQVEVTKQSHKAHQKWSFCLVLGQMTLQMHHATQSVSWFNANIVICVHGELVVATKMSRNWFENSKRATGLAHPKQSFFLVSGQMTLAMHHVTQENVLFVVNFVVCVHGEFAIA